MGPKWLSYTTGAPILSKRVTKCISSCWLNAGLKSHISTTLLKKTIVSKSKTPTYGPGPSGVKFPRAGTMTKTDQDTDMQSTTTDGTESSRMWTGIRHRTEKTPEDETVWTHNDETTATSFLHFLASKSTPTTRQVNETLDEHATTKFVFLKNDSGRNPPKTCISN
ncbi:uncharacterized protein [Apostichopus japonicus]|uniref:uncharacterized protein n=1 Tax=Stichopus japonicus TaxID=307972 RepID=UPI003AB606A0